MSQSRKPPNKPPSEGSNHSIEFVALPEGTGLKPQLDSIFAEVQASLPSIDFDLSDGSSDEEEISIFNRSLKSPPAEVDTQSDSDESSGEQTPTLPPPSNDDVANFTQSWSDLLNTDKNESGNQTGQEFTQTWGDVANTGSKEQEPQKANHSTSSSNASITTQTEEDKESIDEDKDDNVREKDLKIQTDDNKNTSQGEAKQKENLLNSSLLYSDYLPTQTPTLSMQMIDQIDLDGLLEVVDQEKGSSEAVQDSKELEKLFDGDGDGLQAKPASSDNSTLMDKLAQLCLQQSGGNITANQLQHTVEPKRVIKQAWVDDDTKPKAASGDAPSGQRTNSARESSVSSDLETQLPSKADKPEEKETVFLDLRDFDLKKQKQAAGVDAIHRILGIQKDTSDDVSDEGSDDDMSSWHQQRRQIRNTISSGKTPTDDMWGSGNRRVAYKPTRKVTKMRKSELFSLQNIELTNSVQNKADENKADTNLNVEPVKPSEPTPTKEESLKKDLKDKEKQREKEKQKKAEAAKKLREQREHERQSRVRLQRQLETLKPRSSVSGRHTAADSTPTIFDLEASYEPAPQTLPPILTSDQECLLLTIHLSSNGDVLAHRSSGNRKVDNTTGLSATHAVLLTWLLSLVPENFDFLQKETPSAAPQKVELRSTEAPFCVVGLQQLWQENFLSLAVAVTPRDNAVIKTTAPKKKSRMRDEFKDSSPFQQSVSKFLSTNTIHTVCPWLQGLFAYEVGGKGQVPKSATADNTGVQADGSYRPTLPAVTTKPLSTFISQNRDPQAVTNTFGSSVGFFWQTVDCEENLHEQDVCEEYNGDADIQNTLSLIYKHIYRNPYAMMGVLYRVVQEGLDLAGIRVLYPTGNFIPNVHSAVSVNEKKLAGESEQRLDSDLQTMNTVGAILALALRGHRARSKWLDAVGPSDPQLARRTDPNSLCAKYGGESRDEVWLFCPRNPARINSELARWFGGRVPPSGVIDVGVTNPSSPNRKKSKKAHPQDDQTLDTESTRSLTSRRPPATLTASTDGDVFLTVSALVPTQCIGVIVAECQNRGFQLRGIRRVRLSVRRANNMGIMGTQLSAFCPVAFPIPTSPKNLEDAIQEQLMSGPSASRQPPRPGTILLLRKENATHLVHSLIEALMVKLSLLGLLGEIQHSHDDQVKSCHCFHATPFSDSLLQTLGGDFCHTPHHETRSAMAAASGYFYSSAELEQVVVITLTGVPTMKGIGNTLGKILGVTDQAGETTADLELLGIKWLPVLSTAQAKEITPFEVGDKHWHASIRTLMSSPTLLCVLRGINAFQKLQSVLKIPKSVTGTTLRGAPLTTLMSPSAEVAYRQAALFFNPRELFADPTVRANLRYLPPVRTGHIVTPGTPGSPSDYWTNDDGPVGKPNKSKGHRGRHRATNIVYVEEAIFDTMLSGPRPLTTLLVIKPDAFQRHLGKILKRVCQESFNVVAMRLEMLSADEAKVLVPPCDMQNEILCSMHVDYLTSAPVLILCLQRENAVKKLLDLIGPVDPQAAKKTNQFLWRSLFGVDPVTNGLHASFSYSASVMEQKLFFPNGLCCLETPDLKAEKITSPAHDPIIDNGLHNKYKFILKNTSKDGHSSSSVSQSSSSSSTRSMGTSTSSLDLSPIHTSLCQTNCLVVMPQLQMSTARNKKQGYVQLIDGLTALGFDIVAMRMVWFTPQQARHFVSMTSTPNPHMAEVLCQGPCIVIAVQRDNAITCFDQLLTSPYQGDSLLMKYGQLIMRAKDIPQASRFLEFFFDKLMPNSQGEFVLAE